MCTKGDEDFLNLQQCVTIHIEVTYGVIHAIDVQFSGGLLNLFACGFCSNQNDFCTGSLFFTLLQFLGVFLLDSGIS